MVAAHLTVPAGTAALCTVGTIIDAAEHVQRWRANAVAFSLPITTSAHRVLVRHPKAEALYMRALGSVPRTSIVRAIAAICATCFFILGAGAAGAGAAAIAMLATMGLSARLVLGLDGSDQMQLVVWAGLAATALVGRMGTTFIAIQFLLSYLAAGVAKIAGPSWRSGRALAAILGTQSYGSSTLARLARRETVGLLACWSVILLEVGGPVAASTSHPGLVLFVAGAILFHAVIGLVMGLNTFIWAFGGALVCVGSTLPLVR